MTVSETTLPTTVPTTRTCLSRQSGCGPGEELELSMLADIWDGVPSTSPCASPHHALLSSCSSGTPSPRLASPQTLVVSPPLSTAHAAWRGGSRGDRSSSSSSSERLMLSVDFKMPRAFGKKSPLHPRTEDAVAPLQHTASDDVPSPSRRKRSQAECNEDDVDDECDRRSEGA